MLTSLNVQTIKKARKYSPKVRTGCRTCKIRRVKCDEKRPSCLKCINTGRKCDGYTQPEVDYQTRVFNHIQASTLRAAPPATPGLGNNVEHLEFYHRHAGPSLATSFDNDFWSRISLQMAYSEPAVRHALIALGYLNRQETGSLQGARSNLTNGYESNTFLVHYNQSVTQLVKRMAESSYTPELGLVTCVLFVCIEFLRGDYQMAFSHLRNGLKIISELRRRRHNFQSKGMSGMNQYSFKDSTNLIEHSLVPMFVRVMTSALLYGVTVDDDFVIPCPLPASFHRHPFTSIREAQASYYELRNATIVFIRQTSMELLQMSPATSDRTLRHIQIMECHEAWYQALKAFENSHTLPAAEANAISALKVSYYATYVFTACATESHQSNIDTHLPMFQALIHHARIVLKSMELENYHLNQDSRAGQSRDNAAANFTFDISVIPSLYFTAVKCRCPVTRRDAVSLLALNPPREGLWDAAQHVAVANRVIEIEEMEVDDRGWPLEETRLWSGVIDANMNESGGFWVHFLLAKWVGNAPEVWQREVTSEWFVLEDDDTESQQDSPDSPFAWPVIPKIDYALKDAPLH